MPEPVVIVPYASRVEYEPAVAPRETPVGVVDSATMEVRFDGKRYQLLDDPSTMTWDDALAIDLDDGSVVRLRNERGDGFDPL